MLRALAVTGGVITSAGIVLAGTFAVLGTLPLVFLTEIGFVVAFGVLLDTFLVRSVLVPAATLLHRPEVLVAVGAGAHGRRCGDRAARAGGADPRLASIILDRPRISNFPRSAMSDR